MGGAPPASPSSELIKLLLTPITTSLVSSHTMAPALYLRPQPRAFFLFTDTHALVFRQPSLSESRASHSVVIAEFLPIDEVDMRGLVRAGRGRTVEGVLGVTSVPIERSPIPEIFLLLVSSASTLSPLLPSLSLRPVRVIAVEFHSLSSSSWDTTDLAAPSHSAYPFDEDLDDPYGPQSSYSSSSSSTSQQNVEHPCNGMRKYLESGGFFFAEGCKWDISSRMGETSWVQADRGGALHPLETFDERFVWNATLLAPLLAFRSGLPEDTRINLDAQSLLVPVIQGFCGSTPVSTGAWAENGRPEIASLGMISRLSWKRAGARFRTRGIDDDGQVANFVETELILATDNVCLSYVQVRGSVPLFWQQPSAGLQTLQQKVEITRPAQATQPAFDKHFLDLLEHYHSVHAINLLGQKDAEAMLSSVYLEHLESLKATLETTPMTENKSMEAKTRGTVAITQYDFHAAVKTNGNEAVRYDLATRLLDVADSTERFGWTAIDASSGQIIEQQQGVFRINCLDCLDRTNYVQDVISSITLTHFLQSVGSPLQNSPTLWSAHRSLWADNGDRLSKIYAGTGAINTSATRSGKKTFAGLVSDATKSVGRAYITNFQDKGKQAATDMLLGMIAGQRPVILFDPISDSVQSALGARVNEYSQTRNIIIFTGTWNLNAKAPGEALDAWLFQPYAPEPDIYAIAFQEIVELSPAQILATDPAKRRTWELYIMNAFAQRKSRKSEYLLFRSEQLVGTALILVVKSGFTSSIRNVESATKKVNYFFSPVISLAEQRKWTGLQGLSGNKGGVGIRLDVYDSSVCLMTCHLAAGHGNVTERNADYRTILGGLRFLRGKMIEDHEIIIWAADFNYRIGLSNHEVREHAEARQLDQLLASDQLMQAMDEVEVFVGYDEGPITFSPTYKYDNGTDEYDTSEKARIPAWTDRILFKGSALRLREYNRADLRTSDHRPVFAIFDATIREVDHAKKDAIAKEIMRSIRQKGSTGKMDEKIEKVMNGSPGNVGSLVNQMTKSPDQSISPAFRSMAKREEIPRLPPRPNASTALSEKPTSLPPVDPRTASAARDPIDPAPPSSRNGSYAARNASPAIAARASAFVPSASTLAAISSFTKRPPPPIPLPSGTKTITADQPPTRANSSPVTSSPSITPSSTGDYVVVSSNSAPRRGPPLPTRTTPTPTPTPKALLDLDGSPPIDLIPPVLPDSKKSPPMATVKPKSEGKKPPPAIPRKPIALRSSSSTG